MYGLYAENYYNSYENELETLISKYRFIANKKINNYHISRLLSPGEDQLFKKYTNIINNKSSTPEEKQYAKRMLNYLLS